ncbi:MAG: class I SAM-dependent methyltransferase [Candidatus Omnitrophica bacterium]|nr:class I SAM-dependent methyltransferase [Candidatus Omnitrophota bacterium]
MKDTISTIKKLIFKIFNKKQINTAKKYNFSVDNFSSRIPLWEKILQKFKGKPNIHYLEIGLFEGKSFLWMLENILTHPTSTATGIDPFTKTKTYPLYRSLEYEKFFYKNLKISGLNKKTKIIKGFAQVELKKLPHNFYDIIYIDGDHSANAVLINAVLCWFLLKKEGILIFDDYLWKMDELPAYKRPKDAIDCFTETYKDYLSVIHKGYQCIIQKKDYFYWEKK